MLAVESIKALADMVPFVKIRGATMRLWCPPPIYIYNCKHVYMFIVVLTNKVRYANVISYAHRHAISVYKLL